MGSVGACRQCAIIQYRDENDTRGRIVMACMTPAADGMRISINDPRAIEFRASVIEWLMVNHPHDCPVCDEGSECHLQDMTVMTGHVYRRYRGKKRTYRNQYLGPFVNQEMNRCIQCYRCVRFYRGLADGRDFNNFAIRNLVFYGRNEDGVLESEFSGNLVEVCPTGVFTDKTLKEHYTRKWDLQTAPSICVNCSIGCNTIPGERYGTLRRIRNRYNYDVNGYFLCDRGRYGYEFVNSSRRIREPRLRQSPESQAEPVKPEEILSKIAGFISNSSRVIGIGSPRASLEANYSLWKLVGAENFFAGISPAEHTRISLAIRLLMQNPSRIASLHDLADSDAVVVLGEDISNTAPMAAFAIRQAARNKPMSMARKLKINNWDDTAIREVVQGQKGPVYLATIGNTRIDDLATRIYHGVPDEIARLGFAIAHEMDPAKGFDLDLDNDRRQYIEAIIRDLRESERPVIVSGVNSGSESILYAAAELAQALADANKPVKLFLAFSESNSFGLGLMEAGDLQQAFDAVTGSENTTMIVLENDLYRRADADFVDSLLNKTAHVIAIDYLDSRTTMKAEAILPSGPFAESDGTLVNNEARAQRFFQVFVPHSPISESWRWCRDIMISSNKAQPGTWISLDQVISSMVEDIPVFAPVRELTPPASFRIAGQRINRQPHRYSGRTAIHANISVHEPRPPEDLDSPLAFSMEGYQGEPPLGEPPPALITHFWAPGWNSIQALNKFQEEINGPLRGGSPSRRIIRPVENAQTRVAEPPKPFQPRTEEWLLLPLFHVFGSEELSVHTPGVAELAPKPYVAVNPQDAAALHAGEGQIVHIDTGNTRIDLPIALSSAIPVGVAGLPAGLSGMPYLSMPAWAHITQGFPTEGKVE